MGRPGPQCARVDGAGLVRARRRKEATYPELSGANGRARLVVLGCEVGGRWSDECQSFLRQLEGEGLQVSAPAPAARGCGGGARSWLRLLVSGFVVVGTTSGSWRRWSHPTPSSCEVVGDDRYSFRDSPFSLLPQKKNPFKPPPLYTSLPFHFHFQFPPSPLPSFGGFGGLSGVSPGSLRGSLEGVSGK